MATVGYARVSTQKAGQALDQRMDAVKVGRCGRMFGDRAGGACADQSSSVACLNRFRHGGQLIRLAERLESAFVGLRAPNAGFAPGTPSRRASRCSPSWNAP